MVLPGFPEGDYGHLQGMTILPVVGINKTCLPTNEFPTHPIDLLAFFLRHVSAALD
jgi:hypothetical protein